MGDLIDCVLIVLLAISAFGCGYERGKGDQMQDEIDFYEKLFKKKNEENDGEEEQS